MRNRLPKQHYPRAPISEAVIDLRAELPPELSVATLQKVGEGEAEREAYPDRNALLHEQFQIAPGIGSSSVRHEAGFRFGSADGKYVYQARIDGFTLSRLQPYENWEKFRTEAQRLWARYREVAQPVRVTRLAVRYINRIEVPLPLDDFAQYFRTFPEVSSDLPQGLAGYFMQLRMPLDDVKCAATINQTVLDESSGVAPPSDVVTILLDIDIFRTAELPTDDEGIWSVMEQLREEKNQVFEASITPKTRELFQ
jgi:uncharacterized protein (TIGR04255 family)